MADRLMHQFGRRGGQEVPASEAEKVEVGGFGGCLARLRGQCRECKCR